MKKEAATHREEWSSSCVLSNNNQFILEMGKAQTQRTKAAGAKINSDLLVRGNFSALLNGMGRDVVQVLLQDFPPTFLFPPPHPHPSLPELLSLPIPEPLGKSAG